MPQVLPFGEPTTADQTDSPTIYTLGQPWQGDAAGVVSGNRWRAPTNAPANQCRMCLFRVSDMALLAQSNLFTPTPGVNNDVSFTAPASVSAGVQYISGVVTDRYAFRNPPAYPYTTANLTTTGTGRFISTTAGTPVYPTNVSASSYLISPIWDFAMATVPWTPVTLALGGVAFTVLPGMVTVPWSPVALALDPVAVTAVPGMATVPWVPVELALATQEFGLDLGPGQLAAGGSALSTLIASGRGHV